MQRIKFYLAVYAQILKMTLSLFLEYRFNLLIQGLFMVVYEMGMFFLIQVIFLKTNAIAGWSKDEVLLMLAMYMFIWGFVEFLFFDGLRRFTYVGVKNGEADKFLTKPLRPELLISFSSPVPAVLPHQLLSFAFLLFQISRLSSSITIVGAVLFIIFSVFSIIIAYLVDSTYSTFAFHVTKSTEMLRMVQTISDSSAYPLSIFPQFVQPILLSIVPIGFMSYIPASFLIGKGSWQLGVWTVAFMIIMFGVNKLAWKIGWQKYTSASS